MSTTSWTNGVIPQGLAPHSRLVAEAHYRAFRRADEAQLHLDAVLEQARRLQVERDQRRNWAERLRRYAQDGIGGQQVGPTGFGGTGATHDARTDSPQEPGGPAAATAAAPVVGEAQAAARQTYVGQPESEPSESGR